MHRPRCTLAASAIRVYYHIEADNVPFARIRTRATPLGSSGIEVRALTIISCWLHTLYVVCCTALSPSVSSLLSVFCVVSCFVFLVLHICTTAHMIMIVQCISWTIHIRWIKMNKRKLAVNCSIYRRWAITLHSSLDECDKPSSMSFPYFFFSSFGSDPPMWASHISLANERRHRRRRESA